MMDWKERFENEQEIPLENLVTDGGYAAIFRKIACIGDSLSSGEFEAYDPNPANEKGKTYHDMFEYSWGQFMARMCGSQVYNFSCGGMTARRYCDEFAESKGFWNAAYAAQAYIISLGVNDLNYEPDLGTIDDIDVNDWHNNKRNFAGYYGEIIQRLKEIQPRAKFFLVTMPRHEKSEEACQKLRIHRKLLYEMAELFENTYVIDLFEYAPIYDEEFHQKFFMGGHMNPMGYVFSAKMIISYIDYIIRHHMDDFKEIGYIGTNLHGPHA